MSPIYRRLALRALVEDPLEEWPYDNPEEGPDEPSITDLVERLLQRHRLEIVGVDEARARA